MPSMGLICRICKLPMHKTRTSQPQGEAAHNKCRSGADEVPSHGSSGYRKGCRCAECREAQRVTVAAYVKSRTARDGVSPTAAAKRKKRGVDPLATWSCFVCKEPLLKAARGGGRQLHKRCRESAPEWVRSGGHSPKVRAFIRKIDKAARGTSSKRVFVNGGCAWCAETFTAAAGVYCSDKCKTSASFKRRSGGKSFTVSPRVRLAIYERDSWDCQLCARPVDGSLHHRDNWSASLDHIIPQSHMLIPDHSPSNLRLVHRMCNSMRGDGSNMTEAEFHRRINNRFEGVAA